jgi:hypothetical protein
MRHVTSQRTASDGAMFLDGQLDFAYYTGSIIGKSGSGIKLSIDHKQRKTINRTIQRSVPSHLAGYGLRAWQSLWFLTIARSPGFNEISCDLWLRVELKVRRAAADEPPPFTAADRGPLYLR